MISSYFSLAICLAICAKLMFFMNTPRVHAPMLYNFSALLITIYAGSRSIQHLAALNIPTSRVELFCNTLLLAVVLYLSTRLHRHIRQNWRRE